MTTVFDVAKYILNKDLLGMTTMKLQKLCFYCQAYSLAWMDRPLFDGEFRAWKNGPVNYDLFEAHRGMYSIGPHGLDDVAEGSADNVDAVGEIIIDAILDQMGTMTADQLRNMSHNEAPWRDARQRGSNEVISEEAIRTFYKEKDKTPL